jgi:uncharacterized membrane protein
MAALDKWLDVATRGLSPESTAKVQAEIEEHYNSAMASGATSEEAVAALGDPKASNGEYRKVLLTETEAAVAPSLLRPKVLTVRSVLVETGIFLILVWLFAGGRYRATTLPILMASWCRTAVRWVLTAFKFDDRVLRYANYANVLLLVAVEWCYVGWSVAVLVGVIIVAIIWASDRPRASIQRKLDAGQVYGPFPGEPALTHLEAISLRGLQRGPADQKFSKLFRVALVGAMTVWQPRTFGAVLFMLAAQFTVPYIVDVYTAERSRWFRIGKWTVMALAAVLPVFLDVKIYFAALAGLYVALLFWWVDAPRISLRRKLPVEEWPKELYL